MIMATPTSSQIATGRELLLIGLSCMAAAKLAAQVFNRPFLFSNISEIAANAVTVLPGPTY